ncbi:MAG: hypothetical protein ABIE84_02295 [bacterium]
MNKKIVVLLMICLLNGPAFCETATPEAQPQPEHNFWQEFDITFWQGLPWITIWTHFAERQIQAQQNPGQPANWTVILSASTVLSAINAYQHSRRVAENRE